MLERIQNSAVSDVLYYGFHVLGFVSVFFFNIWYGRKRDISPRTSALITLMVYSVTYVWIYIQFWAESGFTNFGGNNIVRGFVYVPLFVWPLSKLFKIPWSTLCDFVAPCVCLSQGVSHIGCIFGGCCAGYPCDWGIYNYRYDGNAFPSQLFEAATALLIVVYLLYHSKKRQYNTGGRAYPLMLVLFGSTRFLWEFARNNEKIWLGCSSLAFHALFMKIVGLDILLTISDREYKKEQQEELRSRYSAKRRKHK